MPFPALYDCPHAHVDNPRKSNSYTELSLRRLLTVVHTASREFLQHIQTKQTVTITKQIIGVLALGLCH